MTRLSRISTARLGLALAALALVGCGGPQLTPPPGSPADTAAQPNPMLAASCDQLIDLDVVQAALGTVQPGTDPVHVPGGPWALNQVGIAQAGGLECYWGDDAAPQRGHASYLSVTVRPGAAAAWATWEQQLASWSQPFAGHGDSAYSTCSDSPDYRYCQYDVLVNDSWLRAEVMNLETVDNAAPIIRALTDAVAQAKPIEQAWAAPPSVALPAACAELLTAAEISAAAGVEGIAERDYPLSMPLIFNTSLTGGLACSWSNAYSSEQAMPIQAALLPGAEWAWEASWAKPRPDRDPAKPLSGLGDQAYAGCAADDSNNCFVDVLAEGVWVAVDGKQAGVNGLREVAAAIVARLEG